MKKHICKNCGRTFDYCRGCLLSPVSYKEAGFCSKECLAEFRAPKIKEVIHKDVEVVINNEDTSTPEEEVEYPYFFTELEEENDLNEDK